MDCGRPVSAGSCRIAAVAQSPLAALRDIGREGGVNHVQIEITCIGKNAAAGAIASANSRPPEKTSPAFDNSMSSQLAAESLMKMALIASGRFRPPRAIGAIACAAIVAATIMARGGTVPGAFAGDRLSQGIPTAERSAAAEAAAAPVRPLPDGVQVPSYSPGPMPFHPGEELTYQASWIGIPAAGGRVVLRRDDPALLSAEIWFSTNLLTDKLYKMRDYLREDFTAASLKPTEMNILQNEGRRHDVFHVTFDHHDHVVTLLKHGPRGQQTRKFLSYNPSGPVSGAMMALSQPLEPGDSLSFDAFSGTTFAEGWSDPALQKAGFAGARIRAVYHTRPFSSKIGLWTVTWPSQICSSPQYGERPCA